VGGHQGIGTGVYERGKTKREWERKGDEGLWGGGGT